MKLNLDFELKTVEIENDVIVGELISKLKDMFSDWKEWKIVQKSPVNRNTPLTTPDYLRFDDRTTINPFLTDNPNTYPLYNPVMYTTSN